MLPIHRTTPEMRYGWHFLITAVLCLAGCGQSQHERNGSQTTYQGQTASEFLQAVLLKYRNAPSYRDDGLARLSYEVDGRLRTEKAPLSVWKNGHDIYVKAYDVQIWSVTSTTTTWISDPDTDNHDSQVMRLPRAGDQFEPNSVMADPVVGDKLSSGLAGPPPQLDWLFAAHPMQRLFEGEHEIRFGGQHQLANRNYLTILVNADGDKYQFWIDPVTSLIHRVDLPSVTSPDDPARHGRLTLELPGAAFEVADTPVIDELPPQPHFVSHFVPLPPPEPAQGLGRAVKQFQLTDRTGKVAISNLGSDRDVTVILLVCDQDSSVHDLVAMNQWLSMMRGEVAGKVRAIAVADSGVQEKLPADLTAPVLIDRQQVTRQAITSTNRGVPCELVVIDRQGRIAWLQESMSPAQFQLLGPIIGDILAGVDVPGRLLDQWRSNVASYRHLLDAEIARHRAEFTSN